MSMNPSRPTLRMFGKLMTLSFAVAVAAWAVGYEYLVKVAGFPAAGFFTFKMLFGLLVVSFTVCAIFRLRGFFK